MLFGFQLRTFHLLSHVWPSDERLTHERLAPVVTWLRNPASCRLRYSELTGRLTACILLQFPTKFSGHCGRRLDVGGVDPRCLEKKMETLIFALIARALERLLRLPYC